MFFFLVNCNACDCSLNSQHLEHTDFGELEIYMHVITIMKFPQSSGLVIRGKTTSKLIA